MKRGSFTFRLVMALFTVAFLLAALRYGGWEFWLLAAISLSQAIWVRSA